MNNNLETGTTTNQSKIMIEKGTKIGNYEIVAQVGKGGMGAVYKAVDTGLLRTVAIKFILASGGKRHEKMLKRFLQEAEICANLQHPNIIKVYHADVFQNMPYIIMEYVEGETLGKYFKNRHDMSWKEKVAIFLKVVEAVHCAHKNNVIHRDIKPSNIMIKSDGEPLLMDFGIAKITGEDRSLTLTGEALGSPNYMAPEQAEGDKRGMDARTDIYALGGVLYYMLTERPPIESESFAQMIYHITLVPPEQPKNINPDVQIGRASCRERV